MIRAMSPTFTTAEGGVRPCQGDMGLVRVPSSYLDDDLVDPAVLRRSREERPVLDWLRGIDDPGHITMADRLSRRTILARLCQGRDSQMDGLVEHPVPHVGGAV
jgi:hypothetical protein